MAAYATEHGGIAMLTLNQIGLTKIDSCSGTYWRNEEIAKWFLRIQQVYVSMLIPMFKILANAFNKHEDESGIQPM